MISALSRANRNSAARRSLEPASAFSKLWIGDTKPRPIDVLSLMSMSDAFFGRIFHVRNEFVPFGTVSLTTYFHTDADDLAAEDITHVLATADAKVFYKSYGDQSGELWSPKGGCSRPPLRWRISRRKNRGQPQRRAQAAQRRCVKIKLAAVEFRQFARDRQTETKTRARFRRPFAGTQHLRYLGQLQTRSIILDDELERSTVISGMNDNPAVRPHERIVE